jgi:DnaK suppressor protein
MTEQGMMHLREALLKQRREIFGRLRRLESDWQALGERDIELEEEAQKADETSLFDQLDELEKDEIEDIDLALCRIAAGSYGICESCEKLISLKRLDVITCAELPDEYKNLTNEELQMVILEHLRNDGRVDREELEVSCRKGVVYLEGVVPSENERQILLRILTDVMGFASVVDHLEINKLIWEREDRAPGKAAFRPSANADEISDDVFESQEKESPYMFPDRPPAEKE